MRGIVRFAAALTCLVPTGTAAAQSCFESQPLPRCRGFWVTEFGGGVRVSPTVPGSWRGLISWELGGMRNLSRKVAVGGTGFWTLTDQASSLGLRPRMRYWVGDAFSVDIAPGVILVERGRSGLGFSGQVSANVTPTLSLVTTVQSIRAVTYSYDTPRPGRIDLFVGARLSGRAGAIAGVVAPLVPFLYVFILCSGGGCFD
jgi:hypothetical protein